MLSLLSLRLPKFMVKVLVPLLLLCLIVFGVTFQSGMDISKINSGMGFMEALASTVNVTRPFPNPFSTKLGHSIAPQNVQISYIPSPNKKGSPKEILAINQQTYDTVMAQKIHEPKDYNVNKLRPPADPLRYEHENATIVALVRNNEIAAIQKTIRQFEKKFNSKFQYPYTFLNDQPFTQRFMDRARSFTNAPVNFVQISPDMWNKPEWIDINKEALAMDRLEKEKVAYAKKSSYHNMCRFYLGTFYNLPELQKYKYYWRIEPNVRFYSDINYDVFKYLARTKKIYGFTINLYDIDQSVETLFPETLKFLNSGDNYKYVNPNGAFQWITENQQIPKKAVTAQGYSTCHFWSNFEIGDMDFFRGKAYSEWFKHLDSTGKFYYERWGDAPVHSLGLALFADKKKIHWFRDIGYYHQPYTHCPNTDSTTGCKMGKFDDSGHNMDQNCMATWIDYEMDRPGAVY